MNYEFAIIAGLLAGITVLLIVLLYRAEELVSIIDMQNRMFFIVHHDEIMAKREEYL